MWKRILLTVLALILLIGGFAIYKIGPSNIVGIIRYDQREEGALRVGDQFPDVSLISLDGRNPFLLRSQTGAKPLVLIFGSFT